MEKIALPLVRNLIENQNSLLVLNGINDLAELGCSRRGDQDETFRLFQLVLEVLLRPIESLHRTKLFKPTRSNGFKLRQRAFSIAPGTQTVYSVFASCIELRRNHIFDLLDEGDTNKALRVLEKDSHGNVFVRDATLVEIESPDDIHVLIDTVKQRLEPDSSFLHAASNEHTHSHVVLSVKLVEMQPDRDFNPEKGSLNIDFFLFNKYW